MRLSPDEVQAIFNRHMRRGAVPSLLACAAIGGAIEAHASSAQSARPRPKSYPEAAKHARALLRLIPTIVADIEAEADRREAHSVYPAGCDAARIGVELLNNVSAEGGALLGLFSPPDRTVPSWHVFAILTARAINECVARIDGRRPFAAREGLPLVLVISDLLIATGQGHHSGAAIAQAIRSEPWGDHRTQSRAVTFRRKPAGR